jgi:hypothetical protein
MEVDEEVAELRDVSGCVWAVVFSLAVVGEAVAEASGMCAWESGLMETWSSVVVWCRRKNAWYW